MRIGLSSTNNFYWIKQEGRNYSMSKLYSRRKFLSLTGLTATGALLAACGASPARERVSSTATSVPTEAPLASPTAAAAAVSPAQAQAEAQVVVGDVMDYVLASDDWPGDFGQVTFKLHEAYYDGDMVYHIRTDASDPDFATANGLVYVPLLNAALAREEATSPIYTFDNGVSEQRSVLATIPGMDSFSPALVVHEVTFNGSPTLLDSVEAIKAAEADGDISVEKVNLIVNYPMIKWTDGGLTVDSKLEAALGEGQLFEPADMAGLKVAMKLHQCYPGSRYIVTDTSTADMAPMMAISASPPTQALAEVAATDEIWVFGNGIEGSGVMGFQPAVFDNKATEPAWSPFWNHFTLVWKDDATPRVLKSSAEIKAAIDAGEVEEFNGVPESHPNGFVVNCPSPILAANTFAA
jgi:hypothetical protein